MEISVNVTVDFSEGAKRFLERLFGVEQEEAARAADGDELLLSGEDSAGAGSEIREPATMVGPEIREPATQQPPQEVVPPTDEEMRALMDIQISKVTGTNDWKESTDERVKQLRRSCTACFKDIARALGADRPTALTGEARTRFLSQIELILVNGDGCEVQPF